MQPKRDEKYRETRVQRKGMTSRETSGLIGPSPGGEAVSATMGPRIVVLKGYLIWLVLGKLNIDIYRRLEYKVWRLFEKFCLIFGKFEVAP